MKLPTNSSYGYQIVDCSRHAVTKYSNVEKTLAAKKSKLFKKLNLVINAIHKFELAKVSVEHKEQIIVGFFILQYARFRLLELYYIFFTKFCDVMNFKQLDMDANFL